MSTATGTMAQINRRLRHTACLAGIILLAGCGSSGSFDRPPLGVNTPPPNFTRGLVAVGIPQAIYPLRARSVGLEGWVMLRFTVDEDGQVVSNTIQTVDAQPPGYFELSARNAARRLRFENTREEPVDDVRYVFRFELSGQDDRFVESSPDEIQFREVIPMRYITPAYPPAALAAGTEGYVVVEMTVTETGDVQDIRIRESEPPGVFDSQALQAASRLRFEPRIVFDRPVAVEGVSYRFDWQLPD